MTECPRCSGEIWNNIEKKRSGMMKKTGPDYACKDKDGCGWVKWPPKGQRPQGQGNGAPAGDRGQKGPSRPIAPLYRGCVRVAVKVLAELVPNATPADVVASAATLFIATTRDGTPLFAPKPKPEPEPTPEAAYDDYDENMGF